MEKDPHHHPETDIEQEIPATEQQLTILADKVASLTADAALDDTVDRNFVKQYDLDPRTLIEVRRYEGEEIIANIAYLYKPGEHQKPNEYKDITISSKDGGLECVVNRDHLLDDPSGGIETTYGPFAQGVTGPPGNLILRAMELGEEEARAGLNTLSYKEAGEVMQDLESLENGTA